jgi:hypothetical protein
LMVRRVSGMALLRYVFRSVSIWEVVGGWGEAHLGKGWPRRPRMVTAVSPLVASSCQPKAPPDGLVAVKVRGLSPGQGQTVTLAEQSANWSRGQP